MGKTKDEFDFRKDGSLKKRKLVFTFTKLTGESETKTFSMVVGFLSSLFYVSI